MSTIGDEILANFIGKLKNAEEVPPKAVEALSTLLGSEKLPKVEQVVSLFVETSGEETL